MSREYNREIPDYGDVFTVDDWENSVEDGYFDTFDGSGYWAKDGKMCRGDEVFSSEPGDATHVVWFNK